MKTNIIITVVIIVLVGSACEKIIMHPKPNTDNLSIFNEYSKLCIEKFALEEVKGVNLQELADSLRPFINADLTQQELFDLMGIFVDRMQEGHTSLTSIDGSLNKSYWGWMAGYPLGFNPVIINEYYYGPNANPDVQIIEPEGSLFDLKYGFLSQDKQIGYIRLISFDIPLTSDDLEKMMQYLKDAKGIIIDVRGNLGGYIDLAARLVSYFTEREVVIGTNQIKNGPGKNDFATSKMTIKPSGSQYTYTKPVVVLHDRTSFSSGSLYCVMMNSLNQVTTIGIRFGGGTGDIMDGFLSNGWKCSVSTSNFIDNKGRPTDSGLEADIPMLIIPTDAFTDAIIEKAIIELQ